MSEITEAQVRRFRRICSSLNKLMREIRETVPEANLYLANDSLHLMKGPSHDERGNHAYQGNSVESVSKQQNVAGC